MTNELDLREQRQQEFEEIYFSQIGMCGCGRPTEVKKFLYELIKNHKQYKDDKITSDVMFEKREKIIKETDSDIIFEFVFHVLESSDLLEHGGSVYSSWLTEKGDKFFELLSENLFE